MWRGGGRRGTERKEIEGGKRLRGGGGGEGIVYCGRSKAL